MAIIESTIAPVFVTVSVFAATCSGPEDFLVTIKYPNYNAYKCSENIRFQNIPFESILKKFYIKSVTLEKVESYSDVVNYEVC